jgi:hypothetical protein
MDEDIGPALAVVIALLELVKALWECFYPR